MLHTVLSTLYVLSNLILTTVLGSRLITSHFTNEATEAYKVYVTCPRYQSSYVAELGFDIWSTINQGLVDAVTWMKAPIYVLLRKRIKWSGLVDFSGSPLLSVFMEDIKVLRIAQDDTVQKISFKMTKWIIVSKSSLESVWVLRLSWK